MTDKITISVVVTSFNRASKLHRMVNSALAQSDVPEEIVVVNDGSSTDYSLVKQWAIINPQVIWVDIENSGVSAARNIGVTKSNSSFIVFCDDDDYFLPDHIYQLKHRIKAENSTKGIYHTHRFELRGKTTHEPPIETKANNKTWQEYYVTSGSMIPSCTCMHRDVALQFPFPEGIKYAEDHEQRLLALSHYPCFPIYKRTVVVDRTDETATNRPVREISKIYRKRFQYMFANPIIRNHIRSTYRHQMLYRWTSLELSEAMKNTPSKFPILWAKAGLKIRSLSNFKTWIMNLIWYFTSR